MYRLGKCWPFGLCCFFFFFLSLSFYFLNLYLGQDFEIKINFVVSDYILDKKIMEEKKQTRQLCSFVF